ncbi:hypothetical protein CFP56_039149, partial [Quercus suber]
SGYEAEENEDCEECLSGFAKCVLVLIDTTKDMDLLCQKEILVNYLGDSNKATSAVSNLNTEILWFDMNSDYKRICKELSDLSKIK